jgi:hypothetical protein
MYPCYLWVDPANQPNLATPSAVIVPCSKGMTWDDWVLHKSVVVRRTRRKEVVPEGQMGFGL